MSTLHLGSSSQEPAKVEGQARLYSMKFCPFAHRIRLVLSFKKIPHDIVNINLLDKPEWYLQISPEGKVPTFVDADGNLVTDSINIAKYLDEKYPEPPLCNEATKTRDLQLLTHYGKIVGIFAKCIHNKDNRPLKIIIDEISDLLVEFEEELKNRGTVFFTGSQPGMLDILMWPWVERAKSLPLLYKETASFNKERFPHIVKWIAEMKAQQFVQENAISYETFAKFIENTNAKKVDYDNI